jgi:chemotaxis methyl-accepting protein methylase
VLDRVADALAPGGAIMLGAGETLPESANGFTLENGFAHRAKDAARVAAA